MQKYTDEDNTRIIENKMMGSGIPIEENVSKEDEKKNYERLMRSVRRTARLFTNSLSVVEKMSYEQLVDISQGYKANSQIGNNSLQQNYNAKSIDNSSKISAYDYILNFIVFSAMKDKKNFSLPRLIHATESALLVSDEQVDIDVRKEKNRWVSKDIGAAVKQLLAEKKISNSLLNHNEYITTIPTFQSEKVSKDWTELEKILASNLYIVYSRIQSGKKPDLSQLKDTVYTIFCYNRR